MNISPLTAGLIGVLALLGVGFYGLLISRNLIKLVIALQILVKAAILGLVIAGNASGRINLGQSLAVTVIVADTIVMVVGLALAIQLQRRTGSLDIKDFSKLRG
jgi:NADH-quinone oxidoreductase subunit K